MRLHPSSDFSVSDIAYKCGYSDPRYFSKCFKQKYGITPTEFKESQQAASNAQP